MREDMVKRAVNFLRHPKVKDAPMERQTVFLKDKALTSEEIAEALRRAATHPTTTPPPTKRLQQGPLRSEAVVAGGLVYISGQTASPVVELTSGDGEDAKMSRAETQTIKALEKVRVLLEQAGSSVEKVILATIYVTDMRENLLGVDEAWKRWIRKGCEPARTLVEAKCIGDATEGEQLLVELQVVALA